MIVIEVINSGGESSRISPNAKNCDGIIRKKMDEREGLGSMYDGGEGREGLGSMYDGGGETQQRSRSRWDGKDWGRCMTAVTGGDTTAIAPPTIRRRDAWWRRERRQQQQQ